MYEFECCNACGNHQHWSILHFICFHPLSSWPHLIPSQPTTPFPLLVHGYKQSIYHCPVKCNRRHCFELIYCKALGAPERRGAVQKLIIIIIIGVIIIIIVIIIIQHKKFSWERGHSTPLLSRLARGRGWGGVVDYPRICLSNVRISQPFQIEGRLIQGTKKSTSFKNRLTNLLLWMQWISLESVLNVYLHVVIYMYMHVSF